MHVQDHRLRWSAVRTGQCRAVEAVDHRRAPGDMTNTALEPNRRHLRVAGFIAASVAFLAVVYLFDPTRCAFLPSCPFHSLTGLLCPGCGSTRAMHQLVHGHFAAAFWYNPLLVTLLPVVVYLAVRKDKGCVKPALIWVLLAVIVAFGVLRNIPAPPFTLLAP